MDDYPFKHIRAEFFRVWSAHMAYKGEKLISDRVYKLTYKDESIVVKFKPTGFGFNLERIFFTILVDNNNFPRFLSLMGETYLSASGYSQPIEIQQL